MTYDEALDFFCNHGNVSRNINDLKSKKPSQLDNASSFARRKGQSEEMIQEARQAIMKEGLDGSPLGSA